MKRAAALLSFFCLIGSMGTLGSVAFAGKNSAKITLKHLIKDRKKVLERNVTRLWTAYRKAGMGSEKDRIFSRIVDLKTQLIQLKKVKKTELGRVNALNGEFRFKSDRQLQELIDETSKTLKDELAENHLAQRKWHKINYVNALDVIPEKWSLPVNEQLWYRAGRIYQLVEELLVLHDFLNNQLRAPSKRILSDPGLRELSLTAIHGSFFIPAFLTGLVTSLIGDQHLALQNTGLVVGGLGSLAAPFYLVNNYDRWSKSLDKRSLNKMHPQLVDIIVEIVDALPVGRGLVTPVEKVRWFFVTYFNAWQISKLPNYCEAILGKKF